MATRTRFDLRADGSAAVKVGDQARQPGSGSMTDRLGDLRTGLNPETVAAPRGGLLSQRLADPARIASSGFTLIELLIVIVVLGILAAVVIFALGGITGKSAVAACQADGATVATAISAMNAQNPGTLSTGAAAGTAASDEAFLLPGAAASLSGPYISSWPSNPTHYAFALVSGTLLMEYPGPAAGTAWAPTTIVPYTASNLSVQFSATNGASGVVYQGPTSCSGV
jgi:prepilin-type N-terminal cleavage/methylation domain-containing protein